MNSAGDPITDLGVQLHRSIPKGRERAEWLRQPGVESQVMEALRNAGYRGNRLARAMFDLSYGEIRLPLTIATESDLAALDGGMS